MESEKVKEIKELLDKCDKRDCECCCDFLDERPYECLKKLHKQALTLINELESENERLNKSDTSKEESSIEYYNLYKDLKRKNKDLNELCELQRVSIAESFVRENQLKDRIAELENIGLNENITIGEYLQEMQRLKDKIAELEKENKENNSYAKGYADGIKNTYEVVVPDKLKQFAERLKEKLACMKWAREDTNEKLIKQGATIKAIDETLKEFIND